MTINPQEPIAQKVADEMVFRCFHGEGVEFCLNLTSLTPPQIFDVHLLKDKNLSSSSFHFQWVFITRSCLESDDFIAYSNE